MCTINVYVLFHVLFKEVLAPQVHQLVKLEQIHTTTCKVNSAVHKLALNEQIGTKAIRR
jgi:hypothetical protein